MEYSSYRLSFDIYFSGALDETWSSTQFFVSGGGFSPDGISTIYDQDVPIVQNEWLSYDSGDLSIGDVGAEKIQIVFSSVQGFADGGFVALDNVTLTFTP